MELAEDEDIRAALKPGFVFCPTYHLKAKPSRHVKRYSPVERPLFPGFVFVKFGHADMSWYDILSNRFVVGLLSIDANPIPVPDQAVQKLRINCMAGAFDERDAVKPPVPKLAKGAEVLISSQHYWLGGHKAVFQGLTRRKDALVELSLFGRSSRIELPIELIELMSK
jgi:transcriptional antiterminator RfaH